MELPKAFEEKMKALLGDEFDSYTACYKEPRYYGLRVNTAKISVEEFVRICPFASPRFRGLKMVSIMMENKKVRRDTRTTLRDYTICRSQAP